ncbi:unnamed protein product [Caenorhabditis brenneri]
MQDKHLFYPDSLLAEVQEYQNRLERWGKGIVEQEDVEFLRPKAIAKNLDIYDEIAKFYHEQNWTAGDSCVVTTSQESVKEINSLIVRYKSISGQLDQLKSWMVKSQPKEFGLPTLIETHKDSIKILVAVGGHVRITESVGSGRNRQRRGAIGKIESVLKIGVPQLREKHHRPQQINTETRQSNGSLHSLRFGIPIGSAICMHFPTSARENAQKDIGGHAHWESKSKFLICADPQVKQQMEEWDVKASNPEQPF